MDLKISSRNNLFLITFLILLCLYLLLILNIRIYPFIDLPYRLATSTILRYYQDATNEFSQYYEPKLSFQPNLIHMVFTSLKIFPSVEFANKLFYCIYIIIFPLSVLLVIQKLKGNVWFSLISFLLIYNFNVSWGFSEFTISIPLFLFFLYFLLDHYEQQKKNKLRIILCIIFIILFFSHVLMSLFALLIFYVFTFIRNKASIRKIFNDSILTLPCIILILIWWGFFSEKSELSTFTFLTNYYKKVWFKTLLLRGDLLILDNFTLFKGIPGKLISFFFSLCIVAPVTYKAISKNKSSYHPDNFKAAMIIVFCSLFCFLFLPDGIPEFSFLYKRFSVLFLLSIIFLTSLLYSNRITNWMKYTSVIIVFIHLLLWADYFIKFQHENQSFNKHIFPDNKKGFKLAALIYDYEFRGRPIYIHFPNYYIVWKHGISVTSLIDYRFYPIRRKVNEEILPKYNEWMGSFKLYFGEYSNMDFILIRGSIPPKQFIYFKNFELYEKISHWEIYKKCQSQENYNAEFEKGLRVK